jgi:hypothetical protein
LSPLVWKLGGVGVILALVFVVGYQVGRAGVEEQVAAALAEAQEATDKAIEELGNEADQIRLKRRLCRDRGGVWDFANNKCAEG